MPSLLERSKGLLLTARKSMSYFLPSLFRFLRDLNRHNNREWFAKNRQRYETVLLQPSLRFIKDARRELTSISPYLVADPKPYGGSLFKIYRDLRFSKDKSPYKTNVAMEFWYKKAKKHSYLGLYLHIRPGDNFLGAGIWHPESSELNKIRRAIVDNPNSWRTVLGSKLSLEGESLKRPPVGFPVDHEFVEDLKRKDFISSVSFTDKQVTNPNFMQDFIVAGKSTGPLNKFLAEALGLPY